MPLDWTTTLIRVVSGLCEEVRMLRDDLYNHAIITHGSAFSLVAGGGSRNFTTAEMPSGATPLAHPATKNTQTIPVAVVVRLAPVATQTVPLTLEDGVLLLSVSGTGEMTLPLAPLAPTGRGQTATVVLKPGETLFVGAEATQAVTVVWRGVPLRGRSVIFTE